MIKAQQHGIWECVTALHRPIATLKPSLAPLAAQLRVTVERSWNQAGNIDAVTFRISRIWYSLSQHTGRPELGTTVWVAKETDEPDALPQLLDALDLDLGSVVSIRDDHGGQSTLD